MTKWVSSHQLAADKLKDISVDVYLYGELAGYGGETASYGFANVKIKFKERSLMRDLLAYMRIPTEKRGITFINGKLSAMPGLQPDLNHTLEDNDRVALFDLKSMWPFQYRHGAMMIDEMANALSSEKDKGLHHIYNDQT